MKRHYSRSEIREFYGHDGKDCIIKITSDGVIRKWVFGVETDNVRDRWQIIGTVAEAQEAMAKNFATMSKGDQ